MISMSNNSNKGPAPDHRVLRLITVLDFVPAVAFSVPFATIFRYTFPAIGLVPLFIGAIWSALHLTGRAKVRWLSFVVDLCVALGLLGCLIRAAIPKVPGDWGMTSKSQAQTNTIVIAVYGTVPMIVNVFIHTYLAIAALARSAQLELQNCPHDQTWRQSAQSESGLPAYVADDNQSRPSSMVKAPKVDVEQRHDAPLYK